MSWIDARELAVARTGEQLWQAVGAGVYAPASMSISESTTDEFESTARSAYRFSFYVAYLEATIILRAVRRMPLRGLAVVT